MNCPEVAREVWKHLVFVSEEDAASRREGAPVRLVPGPVHDMAHDIPFKTWKQPHFQICQAHLTVIGRMVLEMTSAMLMVIARAPGFAEMQAIMTE